MSDTRRTRSLATDTAEQPLLVVATGSFLGEGFDCPTLDTLFLAFPIVFKGRVVQYVGRVLRAHPGKPTIEIHEYVDVFVPILTRAHNKRMTAFRSLGFTGSPAAQLGPWATLD
ncbi:MAG: hypothetical protein ACYDAQ_18295, partial [Mycobacteriales bacterium]